MANEKFIKEIAEKLQNHSSEVNPQMWQAVSSQIGAASAGATSASTLGAGKVAAIVIGIAAISVASYFAVTSTEGETTKKTAEVVQKQNIENPIKIEPSIKSEVKNVSVKKTEGTVNTVEPKEVTKENQAPEEPEAQVLKESRANTSHEVSIPMVTEPIRTIPETKQEAVKQDDIAKTSTEQIVKRTPTEAKQTKSEPSATFGILKLPNVFTPNGDGVQDYFFIESKGLSNYSLVVLDKANNKVWQTADPNAKWDGRDLSGQLVAAGEYIYFVAAEGPNGEKLGKYQRLTVTK